MMIDYPVLPDCFSCPTVFEPDNSTPKDVYNEVRKLWADAEGSNGAYIWFIVDDEYDENKDKYPALYDYLTSFGITECLIHWSW